MDMNSLHIHARLHPNSLKIETELTKLKSWEIFSASNTNSLEADTIQLGLTKLAELFICIEELTHSPQTQQALHIHNLNQVEQVLDGSVVLIDVCSISKDMFLTMQEHIRDLQSALRRRGKDSSIETNIQDYISFRKKAKKDISNLLAMLKKLECNALSFPMLNEENHLSYVIKVIKEVQAIAVRIFRSLMLFLSLPITKTSIGGWSLLSKLVHSGSVASDRGQKIFNEVGRVDIAVGSINGQIQKNSDARFDIQEMQERLKTLVDSIQDLEGKLDSVFRCLIKNRASLLNLVTP